MCIIICKNKAYNCKKKFLNTILTRITGTIFKYTYCTRKGKKYVLLVHLTNIIKKAILYRRVFFFHCLGDTLITRLLRTWIIVPTAIKRSVFIRL